MLELWEDGALTIMRASPRRAGEPRPCRECRSGMFDTLLTMEASGVLQVEAARRNSSRTGGVAQITETRQTRSRF